MITAVDTNILIDIFTADENFGEASAEALQVCSQLGAIVICDVVWAETATAFSSEKTFHRSIDTLGIQFSPMSQHAADVAAKIWRAYRKAGGKRQRIAADFLIGAFALEQCDQLLSRDRGFYNSYFKKLKLIDPSNAPLAVH